MPLIKKSSKKAFEKNVKTEMEANPGKENQKQNLAIAYSTQRAAKAKGKAKGGEVGNPKLQESHKTLERDKMELPLGYNVVNQPHTGRWHVRTPEGGLIPGVSWDSKEGASEAAHRHSESEEHGSAFVPGSSKDRFAKGGGVETAEDSEIYDPDTMGKHPRLPEPMPKPGYSEGGEVCPHCGKMKDGGEIEDHPEIPYPAPTPSPTPEESDYGRDAKKSIRDVFKAEGGLVDNIMERRRRKKAVQDGEVDIDENSEELGANPNPYDRANMLAAKKELYDDDQLEDDPMDSNEDGDKIEEDVHDMVPAIRRRMKHRSK